MTCCVCLFLQGYTTMQMVCSQEMHNLGYAWKTIKEQLGEQFENHIHRMTFLKGKTVCTHRQTCICRVQLLFVNVLKIYVTFPFFKFEGCQVCQILLLLSY